MTGFEQVSTLQYQTVHSEKDSKKSAMQLNSFVIKVAVHFLG
jgi:hypothetical protein